MKQLLSLKSKKLSGNQMKQLKGGAGVGPLPYNWTCVDGPEYWCGWNKSTCIAECPSGVCRQIRNCI
jgi:hypothetical protein